MTSAQLRTEAEQHDTDATYWAGVAAGHWGHSAYCRNIGDVDQAEVYEIRARAAEKSEQRALFRAEGCRLAAVRLEHAEGRAKALFEVAA